MTALNELVSNADVLTEEELTALFEELSEMQREVMKHKKKLEQRKEEFHALKMALGLFFKRGYTLTLPTETTEELAKAKKNKNPKSFTIESLEEFEKYLNPEWLKYQKIYEIKF